jgi:hypothetical protein
MQYSAAGIFWNFLVAGVLALHPDTPQIGQWWMIRNENATGVALTG